MSVFVNIYVPVFFQWNNEKIIRFTRLFYGRGEMEERVVVVYPCH